MFFSSIHAADDLKKYPAAIQRAITYLKEQDFLQMEPGVYEIEGKQLYAQVFDAASEPFADRKPEYHKKYVDVQFLAEGCERQGFTPDTGNYETVEAYEERDLYFVKSVDNEGYIEMTPGCYSVFFPNDIHKPQIAVGEPLAKYRKVVVKVSIDLL